MRLPAPGNEQSRRAAGLRHVGFFINQTLIIETLRPVSLTMLICRRTIHSSPGKASADRAELHGLDVLGARAFRTSAFRERHLLALVQVVETDALNAR